MKAHRKICILLLSGILAALPQVASACATCFGNKGDSQVKAMNVGILALLFISGFVLGGIFFFFAYIYRKSQQLIIEGPEDLGIPRISEERAIHD